MGGRPVELTATEYELLRALSLNAGRVSSHEDLLRRVWSKRDDGNPKIVRAYVKRLRRKLGDDTRDPVYILNHRGVGYSMPDPEKR